MNVLCFDGVLSWSLPKSHGQIISIKDHNRRSYNPDYELFVSITKTHFHNNSEARCILKDEFVKSFDYANSNPLRDIFFKCISNSSITDLSEDEEDSHIQVTDLFKLPDSKILEPIKTKSVVKSSSPLVNDNLKTFYFDDERNKKSSEILKKRPISDSQKSKEESIQSNDVDSVIYDEVDFSSLLEDVSRIDSNVDNSNVLNNQSNSAVIVDSGLGYRQIIDETRNTETAIFINQFEMYQNNIPFNANNSVYIPIYQSQLSYGQVITSNDMFNQTSSIFLSPHSNSPLSNNFSYQRTGIVTSNISSNSHCNSIPTDDYEDDEVDPCYKKFRNNDMDYAYFHAFNDDDIDNDSIINQIEEDDNLCSDFMDSPDITSYHIRNSTIPSTNINNVNRFNSLEIDSGENMIDANSHDTGNSIIILNPTTVDPITNNTDNLDSSEIRVSDSIFNQIEEDDNLCSDFMDSPDITSYHIRNSTIPSTNINNVNRFNSLEIDSGENMIDANSHDTGNSVIILNPTTVDPITNNTDNLDSSEISDLDIFDHDL
eukprot:gene21131-27383_t